jgi:hypothetical protein
VSEDKREIEMADDFRFSTERFGLNGRETYLLLESLNGVGVYERQPITTQWLTQTVYAAVVESHEDLAEFNFDLGTGESNPEIPYERQDLCEKLAKLQDWQSAALYFYACGFFEGQAWALRREKKQSR